MKVRTILDTKGRHVVTIRPDASVSTAVHRLVLERIGALVVSEDGHKVAGIISERDIIQSLAKSGPDLLTSGRRVAELMEHNVITCTPDDTVQQVMAEMTRRRVRHLPVIEEGMMACPCGSWRMEHGSLNLSITAPLNRAGKPLRMLACALEAEPRVEGRVARAKPLRYVASCCLA